MGNALTTTQSQDLHRIAGIMIPADTEYGVPAASDPVIFADIMASIDPDFHEMAAALDRLAAMAGGSFADLDDELAEAVAHRFLDEAPAVFGRAVLQCYYRDGRVLLAVGHEARPPFPKGYTVEQGDWSLLDAVRDRPQLWRDA